MDSSQTKQKGLDPYSINPTFFPFGNTPNNVYDSSQLPFPTHVGLWAAFSAQNTKFSKVNKISTRCRTTMVDTAFESPDRALYIFDHYLSEPLN